MTRLGLALHLLFHEAGSKAIIRPISGVFSIHRELLLCTGTRASNPQEGRP
jgi:hypothetical protein